MGDPCLVPTKRNAPVGPNRDSLTPLTHAGIDRVMSPFGAEARVDDVENGMVSSAMPQPTDNNLDTRLPPFSNTDKYGGEPFPSSMRRGGCDIKKNVAKPPNWSRRGGRAGRTLAASKSAEVISMLDHPVR